MQYIAYSAVTWNMTPDADGLTKYKYSRPLSLTNGRTTSIAGYDDLTVAFHSDNGWVHVKLHDVAHVPLLRYSLISLSSLALKSHTYAGDKDGVSQAEGGEDHTCPPHRKALPPVWVPRRGEG